MFNDLIVQPIFNLLVLIYSIIPGHDFGLAIIIFTVIVRLLMWPLVKKQLKHAKAMRDLQPEIKKIKAATKGERQKESQMLMELYKEREINPFSSIGIVLVQLPIFIGLYSALRKLINDPQSMISFTYPALHNLPWIKTLTADIHQFNNTLFGIVDLSRAALDKTGGIYWPAMIIVLGSAIAQYFQSKMLMPVDKDARGLRSILRDAGSGKSADQSEVNAAVGRMTIFFVPALIFLFTVRLPAALSLYWLTSALVAIVQQSIILREDEAEMEKDLPPAKTTKPAAVKAVEVPKLTRKKTAPKKTKKRRKK